MPVWLLPGHWVGQGKVKPEEAKGLAISTFLQPQTKKYVKVLLDNDHQTFVIIASPLSDLTKNEFTEKMSWKMSHQKAFDQLKSTLTRSVFASPNFNHLFILQIGTSNVGIEAVLSQSDKASHDKWWMTGEVSWVTSYSLSLGYGDATRLVCMNAMNHENLTHYFMKDFLKHNSLMNDNDLITNPQQIYRIIKNHRKVPSYQWWPTLPQMKCHTKSNIWSLNWFQHHT